MKKSILLCAILFILSLIFVSCADGIKGSAEAGTTTYGSSSGKTGDSTEETSGGSSGGSSGEEESGDSGTTGEEESDDESDDEGEDLAGTSEDIFANTSWCLMVNGINAGTVVAFSGTNTVTYGSVEPTIYKGTYKVIKTGDSYEAKGTVNVQGKNKPLSLTVESAESTEGDFVYAGNEETVYKE